jgi:hypothetical protein
MQHRVRCLGWDLSLDSAGLTFQVSGKARISLSLSVRVRSELISAGPTGPGPIMGSIPRCGPSRLSIPGVMRSITVQGRRDVTDWILASLRRLNMRNKERRREFLSFNCLPKRVALVQGCYDPSGPMRRRSRRPAESRDRPRTPARAGRGRRYPIPLPRVWSR